MMKGFVIILIVFVFTGYAHPANSENEIVQYWSNVFSDRDFYKVLSVFQAVPKKDWPAVYSVKFASPLEASQEEQQASFRKLCGLLTQKIEDFEEQLRDLPLTEFCKGGRLLLSMRRYLDRNPSYINLVLVDTVNRVVYVNLSERIAHAKDLSPCLEDLLKILGEFRPNLQQLNNMTEAELGKSVVNEAMYRSASDAKRLEMLWSALEPGTPLMLPKNIFDLGTYQLMKKQDIPLLLNRLTLSDLYIHSLLPALVLYRQEAEAYSPKDSYQKIKAVLDRDRKVNESLGIKPFGVSRAASAINYMLQDIQSRRVRKQLLFHTGIDFGQALPNGENHDSAASEDLVKKY